MPKKRLDILIVEKGLVQSRPRARSLIMAGSVMVNDRIIDKAGVLVSDDAKILLKGEDLPFVSRGGLKLENALNLLNIDINNLVCLDVGASTGGFTDCLLSRGALKVYAVDVGYGQLAWKLRQDPRVIVIERTNIRYAKDDLISEKVDLVTIDVSFISLKIVIPSVLKFMKEDAIILALIKPQFEVGKDKVGKGGVVKDPLLHNSVIEELLSFLKKISLSSKAIVPSPVLGPKGNKEFICYLTKTDHAFHD